MQHLLEIDDLTPEHLQSVLARATRYRTDPQGVTPSLAGRTIAMLFEKPSARTRMSTEAAMQRLGGHAMFLRGEEIGLGVRESAEDVVRTVAGYAELFAARVFDHGALQTMAAGNHVPILNLLSDQAHPCQSIADLLTIQQHAGTLAGQHIAYIGEGNNVARSLCLASAMTGVQFTIASPVGYELPAAVVERAAQLGGSVTKTADPYAAVQQATVLYTDVWVSMGSESETSQRAADFHGFTIDEALLAAAPSEAVVLHCLPAHRGEEISAAVMESKRCLVWPQAANRMWGIMPVLEDLIGVSNE